jgi:hypothetical protein
VIGRNNPPQRSRDIHASRVRDQFSRMRLFLGVTPVMMVDVDSLKPNELNATLFAESLTEASIKLLADDMHRNGQNSPILASRKGVIIDGERRWRAAKLLEWQSVEVTTVKVGSRRGVIGRIIGSVSAQRHMTLREQVNVYQEYRNQLRREHGRAAGRPSNDDTKHYMTSEEIKLASMKLAHIPFKSTTLMDQLVAVFTKGAAEVQERVNTYDLSISRAYETIRKSTQADAKPEEDLTEYEADALVDTDRAKAEARIKAHLDAPGGKEHLFNLGPCKAPSIELITELLANDPTTTSLTGDADLDAMLTGGTEAPTLTESPKKNKPAQAFDSGVEAVWTLESPEAAIERLAAALEASLQKLGELDADRARLCVRRHVRPVVIRIGTAFSR